MKYVLVESLIKLAQKVFKNKNRIGALKYVQLASQVFYESFLRNAKITLGMVQ